MPFSAGDSDAEDLFSELATSKPGDLFAWVEQQAADGWRVLLGSGACRRTAARKVQRGRDQHERGGNLEVLHDGNAHGLAQEAVVIRESKGRVTRC